MHTTNFEKHTTNNPISKFFLDNFSKVLIQELQQLAVESILDVGAGEGFMLQKLAENKIGNRREGIEYMDEAIALGKKLHPGVSIRKGDIYRLPYKDESFDVVLCTEVLEHIEKPDEGLGELMRVSKKFLILSVPNEPYFTIQRFLRGKNILKLGDHPEHIQHWSSSEFRSFIGKKLSVITMRRPLPWTLVVAEKN